MPEIVPPRIPAGMRDILPEQMLKRQYVLDLVAEVFEEFGFEPLQTSAVELSETLMGKYGPDAERLIYKTWYGSEPGDEFALRYDLSVPLSRVVAMYPDLPRPFKRYQIAPVWRADRPQKGRYREFFQCDVDIVGTNSILADAEIVTVIYEVLNRLGFTKFTISINNRKLIDGIGQYAGVPDDLLPGLYRSIDKFDKIGEEGVRRELLMVGVPDDPVQPLQRAARLGIQGKLPFDEMQAHLVEKENLSADLAEVVLVPLQAQVQDAIDREIPGNEIQSATRDIVQALAPQLRDYYGRQSTIIPGDVVDRLMDLLLIDGPVEGILDDLSAEMSGYPKAVEGIEELRALFAALDAMGVPRKCTRLNFAMVRGLAYYTGPIFETTITEPKAMPSIVGGGRYDELIGLFSETSYPATGTSLGIERIIDAMDELNMFPADIRSTTAEVLVTAFSAETLPKSMKLAAELRKTGVKTALYFEAGDRLGDQIGYASAKGIPFVIVLGPDEIAAGEVTVRRLGETRKDSEQRNVPRSEVANAIRSW
ncbi:MAG: histidine--tRNA ligase [Anaerolineae bacterium]|nr:histidine--tRNA ligase [Anaerolineae bacterium]